MVDVRKTLGAGPPSGNVQVTVILPGQDRDGRRLDQEYWREEALRILGTLFRGATAFPPGRGVWRDDARGSRLLFEEVVLVTSYVPRAALTPGTLAELRRFLHRFGREARQGEVGIVVGGMYHGITEFDPPETEKEREG